MRSYLVILALVVVADVSCDGLGPTTGTLRVSVTAVGGDFDEDGYQAVVDGDLEQPIAEHEKLVIPDLPTGAHDVALRGVAANCMLQEDDGPNPRTVTVTAGDTTDVTFALECVVTGVEITVVTTGPDQSADTYTLVLDGWHVDSVPANGTLTITRLTPGNHTLALTGLGSNCSVVDTRPHSVSLGFGQIGSVSFEVVCAAWTGAIEVSAVTTGDDLDPDGYTVVVGSRCGEWSCSETRYALQTNGSVTISRLWAEVHYVWLEDVARNCVVSVNDWEALTVTVGDTLEVSFPVTCTPLGALEVTTVTTGMEPDSEYSVSIWGAADTSAVVEANATVTFHLPAGEYTVHLDDVALACEVTTPNPVAVDLASGATTAATFDVTCAGLASVQLDVTTTGIDPDPDGYQFALWGERFDTTGVTSANGTVTIAAIPGGDYTVRLGDVAINCDVDGPNPDSLVAPSGGNAEVTFAVGCAQLGELAVTKPGLHARGDIYVAKANGTGLSQLTTHWLADAEPAWSPDGSRIAFTSERDGNAQVYVINADGSDLVRLTTDEAENDAPSWSPDGTRIAFSSTRDVDREIYVMNADGSVPVRLTAVRGYDGEPAWSPDGNRIAFTSTRGGDPAIYVMNADGSGVTRLTRDGASALHPDWSPDGSRLAFSRSSCYAGTCNASGISVMNADGSGVTTLTSGGGESDPAWSPDGRWIAYHTQYYECYDYWYDCTLAYTAVEAVRSDGSDVVEILRDASDPAWRP